MREKLEDLWGVTQTDYQDELESGIEQTITLFKQWALEMVGEDMDIRREITEWLVMSKEQSEGYNKAKQDIRARIEESCK